MRRLTTLLALAVAVGACNSKAPPADPVAIPGLEEPAAPAAGDEAAPPGADEAAEAEELVDGLAPPAPLTERREATVEAVWFRGPEGPQASGGTSTVTVRIEPNGEGEASVGVIEEYAGGAGNMWRSAAWMAAFNASNALGYLLTDHEFLVRAGGHIDGPSAGMLITATMIAVMNGAALREDTTMSGTVNPDGSTGPVGGIPQKMQGAKEKGFTRFGYPVGGRNATDLKTGQVVDLEVFGRDLGVEVREIKDLRDAYAFMTDRELPEPTLANESDMGLDPDLRTRVKAKLMHWQSELQSELPGLEAKIKKMPREVKQYILPIFARLEDELGDARRYEQSGLEVPAYQAYISVVAQFKVCLELVEFLDAMRRGQMDRVDQQIARLKAVEGKVGALALELGVQARRKSIGGAVNGVAAFAMYNMTRAFMHLGNQHHANALDLVKRVRERKLPRSKEALEAMVQEMMLPVVYYSISDALTQAARESMDFAPEEGRDLELDEDKLLRLAKAYGSAASAGLSYFESTVIEAAAESHKVSMAQARAHFQQLDGNYIVAPILAMIAGRPTALSGGIDKAETPFIRLAAGALAYIQTGGLVNKFYSLGYQPQQDGSTVLGNRRALGSQLDLAKRAALAAAGDAQRHLGFIPATAKLAYEEARALREGDDEDKLTALTSYWLAAFWSNLAVTLARH